MIVAVSITGAPARVIPIPAGQSVAAFDLSHDGAWIVYSADVTPRQTLVELDLSSWLK